MYIQCCTKSNMFKILLIKFLLTVLMLDLSGLFQNSKNRIPKYSTLGVTTTLQGKAWTWCS